MSGINETGARLDVVIGRGAQMELGAALNYIQSGKAELEPLVLQAQNAAQSALQNAQIAQNAMANFDEISQGAAKGATAVQSSDLESVAFSGSYNDLIDKPQIGDMSTYQVKSNLVTSLSASSTDTQYPSAKCVYDLMGDIEALINAL